MHFSTILALTAATLAAALPQAGGSKAQQFGTLAVTDFDFDCDNDDGPNLPCEWKFAVSNPVTFANHPAITRAVKCEDTTRTTSFQSSCSPVRGQANLKIDAYVTRAVNGSQPRLFLQYIKTAAISGGQTWIYTGNTTVTEDDDRKDFQVRESAKRLGN